MAPRGAGPLSAYRSASCGKGPQMASISPRRHGRLARAALLAALLASLASPLLPQAPVASAAGVYSVSTVGNDADDGSLAHPWRTLQRAADTAASGATIQVRGGTYAGFTLRRPGLAFEGYPG